MIAKVIKYCPRCNDYYEGGSLCLICQSPLEDVAIVNANELALLIGKLSTPEGIVNLLQSFKEWVEK